MKIHTFLAALALAGLAAADEPLRFNRDIRPILSDTCFHCHGPDAATREAGMRLDIRDAAIGHGAFVPGNSAESAIVARITSADPDALMPPPESKLALTAEQIETLRRWIDEGAVYEPHWAFAPVEETAVPAGADHPVDAFIRERLAREGVEPAPEAEKEALLRRVAFDVTGLPPDLDAMDAFLADTAPGAYERAVDRFLASPAYGERMANEWLDAARYADTFGYQADVASNMWPWRDWVIEAFNKNLPYDDFARWQLAGDLLPNPTQEQRLATAFNRLHRQTNEGGSINEEYRQEYIADRVRTFGMTFLAMTFECARCHDHKFDPISQREYFSLSAFFGTIDESGIYSHFTNAVPTPSMLLYKDGETAEHARLRDEVTSAEAELRETREAAGARFRDWLEAGGFAIEPPAPAVRLPLDAIAEGKTPEIAAGKDTKLSGAPDLPVVEETDRGQALRFSGDNAVEVVEAGAYSRTDPFTVALWMRAPAFEPRQVVLHYSKAREDAGSRGWALELDDGRPVLRLAHFWPGNAIEVRAVDALPTGEWAHVAAAYDGSSRAGGVTLYVNGRAAAVEIVRDKLYKDITYESSDPKALTLGARFRDTGFKDGLMDDVTLYDAALTPFEAAAIAGPVDWSAAAEEAAHSEAPEAHPLFDYYCARIDPPMAEAQANAQAARKAESAFVQTVTEMMAMEEMANPPATYLLARGAYDAPTEPVDADTPAAIMPFGPERPRNRLGLADWLLDEANPLAARVAVNRYWGLLFGRGLVETPEDFGSQGALPSHPELLDWLAARFVESGWDVKAFMKLLVTSETYKQDARPRPELAERDPFNILLAQGPRTRLSAEAMRDQALFASGLLVPVLGGPSVKPYQPEGLWEDASWAKYEQDHGEALYRRSMYTFWKRTVPPPTMLTFDATSREVCIARREMTQTPLQSLTLLNETGFVEAARVMAARVLAEHAATAERLTAAYRMLTGRAPGEAEMAILTAAFDEQRRHFAENPEGAHAYIATGEWPAAAGIDPIDQAAFTAVIQAVMNLDEAQTKS